LWIRYQTIKFCVGGIWRTLEKDEQAVYWYLISMMLPIHCATWYESVWTCLNLFEQGKILNITVSYRYLISPWLSACVHFDPYGLTIPFMHQTPKFCVGGIWRTLEKDEQAVYWYLIYMMPPIHCATWYESVWTCLNLFELVFLFEPKLSKDKERIYLEPVVYLIDNLHL
jgi:hypothetical protein